MNEGKDIQDGDQIRDGAVCIRDSDTEEKTGSRDRGGADEAEVLSGSNKDGGNQE